MKNYGDCKCRFVKEYANFRIAKLQDDGNWCPENKLYFDAKIIRIRHAVNMVFSGHITVDEGMRVIAEA